MSTFFHQHWLQAGSGPAPARLRGQFLWENLSPRSEAEQVWLSLSGGARLGLREGGGWPPGGLQSQGGQQHRDEGGVRQAVSAGAGVPLQVCRVQRGQQTLYPQQRRQENPARGIQIWGRVSSGSFNVNRKVGNITLRYKSLLTQFLSSVFVFVQLIFWQKDKSAILKSTANTLLAFYHSS